jgi:uncharacterized protein YjbI with pentapeptide repeats
MAGEVMSWLSSAWDWYAAHSDKVNPIVAGLGGAALVWAAIRQARTATDRHYEQTHADQQRRLTETFSKAVEQLASEKTEVRVGGIYTLERLGIEATAQVRSLPWWRRRLRLLLHRDPRPVDPASDLYWTVMETLTAFVRERTHWEEPNPAAPEVTPSPDLAVARLWETMQRRQPSTDIAAVLAVIERRPDGGREHEQQRDWHFDLRATDLRGADFRGHLERAWLAEAHLERANLNRAHLERAYLVAAHLERAFLSEIHLEDAVLLGAHLQDALLDGAHLERTFLNAAHLERADLRGAHLEGAHLTGAFLEGTSLDEAIGDAKTQLPMRVPRPAHWPPYEPGEVPSEPSSSVSPGVIGRKFIAKLRSITR